MNNLHDYLHIVGVAAFIGLSLLSLTLKRPRLKQRVARLIVVVLVVLAVDTATHVVPHALARFMYSSLHSFYAQKPFTVMNHNDS